MAKALEKYRGKNPLILAIPRGALPMGEIIARELQGDLDVVLVHKLGAPGQEELAIGAVDESGEIYLSPHVRSLGVSEEYLEEEVQKNLEMLRRRRAQYTPVRPPIDPKSRITIVIDDGIATGATMLAALRMLRARKPAKLIVATAVAPPSTLDRLGQAADEVVCLEAPEDFYAVGQFFRDFSPISDEEVIRILSAFQRPRPLTPD